MKDFKSSLINGMTEIEYRQLLTSVNAERLTFLRGDVIYEYNLEKGIIGIVVEGVARVTKNDETGNEILLERLKEGSLFGDSLNYGGKRGDYVVVKADKKCTVVIVKYSELMKSCDTCQDCRHKFLMNLFEVMRNKTTELGDRIEIISCKTIREKLICYFKLLSARQGSKMINLDMSLSSVAEYIGADRSAMMRELKHMKDDGVIDIDGKVVKLINK